MAALRYTAILSQGSQLQRRRGSALLSTVFPGHRAGWESLVSTSSASQRYRSSSARASRAIQTRHALHGARAARGMFAAAIVATLGSAAAPTRAAELFWDQNGV